MFQNDIQSISGSHTSLPHTELQNLPRVLHPSEITHFTPNFRPALLRNINAKATAAREKQLSLPSLHSLAADVDSKPPAILYRNSVECRPYHRALHAFEGSQFGNDFTGESADFEHWFNAESYFCAAAFSNGDSGCAQILSLVAMLFVTETSAREFLGGARTEQELMPFDENSDSAPVIYFSSLAAENFAQLIPLYKILLKDIDAYKSKFNVAPEWGFSIGATDSGIRYLTNCGFYKTEIEKYFLDKYAIVKIDRQSARSKIWTSIFRQPTPIVSSHWLKSIKTLNSASRIRFRSKNHINEEAATAAIYNISRIASAPDTLPEVVR